VTRTLITELPQGRPDAIVAELGDGMLGAYGVESILRDAGHPRSVHGRRSCPPTTPSRHGAACGCCASEYGIEPVRRHRPRHRQRSWGCGSSSSGSALRAVNARTDPAALARR
jgi:hypothetical protein